MPINYGDGGTSAAGRIIQVEQSVKTNTQSFSTGSSTIADSYFDITGLSVSLTPASGTKILVSYSVNIGGQSGYGQGLALLRDNTSLYRGDANSNRQRLSNFDFTLNNEDMETFSRDYQIKEGQKDKSIAYWGMRDAFGKDNNHVWLQKTFKRPTWNAVLNNEDEGVLMPEHPEWKYSGLWINYEAE